MSPLGSLFIFEGPDGVGKTTLVRCLRERLDAHGLDCVATSFPGREPRTIGGLVYRLHHDPSSCEVSAPTPATLQLLHVAAHVDAIEQLIRPALEAGSVVLLDRYWWSTVAYGLAAGLTKRSINAILRPEMHFWSGVVPRAAFLLERPTVEGHRSDVALSKSYLKIARQQRGSHPVHFIANDGPLESVVDATWREIAGLLELPVPNDNDSRLSCQAPEQLAASAQRPQAPAKPPRTAARAKSNGVVRREPTKRFPVYDTYWRFAAKRQDIFFKRLRGQAPPWTTDQTLQQHKFTNVYRACDRVSQFLIRHVIREGDQGPAEVFFRTILFKIFNRIETWRYLESEVGPIRWTDYQFDHYDGVLNRAMASGTRIYSAAYIMPSARFGHERKHSNHLRLIERMMREDLPSRLRETRSMDEGFALLRAYPSIGDFLAYQYITDLNYSDLVKFEENEFVVAGPGARDGIHKCFSDLGDWTEADIIKWMADHQDDEFRRLELSFEKLWGRDLQYIDCQNLFCEVGKYARVAHPDELGISGRTRIKQSFKQSPEPIHYTFPRKWGIADPIVTIAPPVQIVPAQTAFWFPEPSPRLAVGYSALQG